MNNSGAFSAVSSNVCRVNRLMVLNSLSFYKTEKTGKQMIEYNIDSIINVLRNFGLSSTPTNITQQAFLTGLNNIGNSRQGTSVALSSDGNTAAIGCPLNNGSIGAVLIFIRIGTVWEQQYGLITGTGNIGNSKQGISVSLSANGNTLAIGGEADNGNIGATWIFTRTNSAWVQQTKLIGAGNIGNSKQGTSVSLSSDGNTIAIGGPDDNGGIGATWIFIRTGILWTQQAKLIGTGNAGNSRQGSSVSLSSNILAVGGYADDSEIGAVWIFERTGIIWSQPQPKLIGTGRVSNSKQGQSVALSQDGSTLVIGAPGNDNGTGAIWIFKNILSIWTQVQGPVVGTASSGNSNQGSSVSLSSKTIIVGGSGNNYSIGSFWTLTLDNNLYEQNGYRITGTGYTGTPLQGTSVFISGDESTVIVGGPGNNNGIGSSWIFV